MNSANRSTSRNVSRTLPTLRLVSAPSTESVATDEQLFREFRTHDDQAAFDTIVHRYESELCGYLKKYLGNAESAEDVFQSTFLKIYLNRGRFEDGRTFRPWLYTVATNQAIDSQRRVQARRMVSLDQGLDRDSDADVLCSMLSAAGETAAEVAEGMEASERVREAVDNLPENLKDPVVLVYYQGLKYEQAAHVLGIPVGTVKSRLHTALVRLGSSLKTACV